jgi:predicted RNase H-like HicB family nuclease
MDACYYSLIRRARDGRFVAWIPDIPGITAVGPDEDQVIRELSRSARECLHKIVRKGLPPPATSPADDLPLGDHIGLYRRVLLILSQTRAQPHAAIAGCGSVRR